MSPVTDQTAFRDVVGDLLERVGYRLDAPGAATAAGSRRDFDVVSLLRQGGSPAAVADRLVSARLEDVLSRLGVAGHVVAVEANRVPPPAAADSWRAVATTAWYAARVATAAVAAATALVLVLTIIADAVR